MSNDPNPGELIASISGLPIEHQIDVVKHYCFVPEWWRAFIDDPVAYRWLTEFQDTINLRSYSDE